MRRLASLATARRQSGHRKQYEPRLVVGTDPHRESFRRQLDVTAARTIRPDRRHCSPIPCLVPDRPSSAADYPFGRASGWLETPGPGRRHTSLPSSPPWHDGAAMAVITFAHRGARLEAPENTIPAFRRALEQGTRGARDRRVAERRTARSCASTTPKCARGLRRLRVADTTAAVLAAGGVPRMADVYAELGTDFDLSVDVKESAAGPGLLDRRTRARGARTPLGLLAGDGGARHAARVRARGEPRPLDATARVAPGARTPRARPGRRPRERDQPASHRVVGGAGRALPSLRPARVRVGHPRSAPHPGGARDGDRRDLLRPSRPDGRDRRRVDHRIGHRGGDMWRRDGRCSSGSGLERST